MEVIEIAGLKRYVSNRVIHSQYTCFLVKIRRKYRLKTWGYDGIGRHARLKSTQFNQFMSSGGGYR